MSLLAKLYAVWIIVPLLGASGLTGCDGDAVQLKDQRTATSSESREEESLAIAKAKKGANGDRSDISTKKAREGAIDGSSTEYSKTKARKEFDEGSSDAETGKQSDEHDNEMAPETPKPVDGSMSSQSGQERTLSNVKVTFYGFDDNDDGSNNYGVSTVAYPEVRNLRSAREDLGTYERPSTFAAPWTRVGDVDFKPGTMIYVARLKKYYVLNDTCRSCNDAAVSGGPMWIDLYMGDNILQGAPLFACQNKYTTFNDTIIMNPPNNLPVDTAPLFHNGVCK